jgi:hypothetical protein
MSGAPDSLVATFETERDKWRLPWSVKPFADETHESLFRRLMTANHLTVPALRHLADRAATLLPDLGNRRTAGILEMLAGLSEGSLDDTLMTAESLCEYPHCRCRDAVGNDRYLCVQCAQGQTIPLTPNLKPFVCIKHGRWVGPGTEPKDQVALRGGPDLVAAARRHRVVLAQGRFDPTRFGSIWQMLTYAYTAGEWSPRAAWLRRGNLAPQIVSYPAAIAAYAALEDPARLSELLNPSTTRAAVEHKLEQVANACGVGDGRARVAQLLRYHLRPDFYRVAIATTPGWHDGRACNYPVTAVAPHDRDLTALDTQRWPTTRAGTAPGFPGFDNNDSVLYIEPEDRAEYRFEFWYDAWTDQRAVGWKGYRKSGHFRVWVCLAGHLVRSTPNRRTRADVNGCAACVGRVAVRGVTDIATTHPSAFDFWDHSKNTGRPYWTYVAGSANKVHWRCRAGHRWEMSILVFMLHPHCKKCSYSKRRLVNIAVEFPELVSRWDPEANSRLDPRAVAFHVDLVVWRCPEGHITTATVYNLNRSRYKCARCAKRLLVPGVNDFQTLHPSEASEFAVSLNGGLTADRLPPRTSTRYKFICRVGHVYERSPYELVNLKRGCTRCNGHRWVPGEIDLLTVKPAVAARWDYSRNGELTPDRVHPNTSKKAYFTCLCGEPWYTEIRAMRLDRYCKKCTTLIWRGRLSA